MKKWLKRHGRKLMIALGILAIGNSVYWLFIVGTEQVVFHAMILTIWVFLLFFYTGLVERFYKWWEKD